MPDDCESDDLKDPSEYLDKRENEAVRIVSDDEANVQDESVSVPNESENTDRANLLNYRHKQKDAYYRCTACDRLANEVHRHPLLKVIICIDCIKILESKNQSLDNDCLECYCGWCGRSSDLINCTSCNTLFCSSCVKRNFGEEFYNQVKSCGWQCCCCSPNVLQDLSSQLEKLMATKGLSVSSSDSDSDSDSGSDSESDDSDADLTEKISSKRNRKKKIRRILDDAELGEETKRKIAMEKERQERLKSLGAQFSHKSVGLSSTTASVNLHDGDSVEVLGDASTGYIVNVVREEGEAAVRIPCSISTKLKPHQIAGIRFMWENII
ncbi:hypothetical protein Leryth_025042 [Lithospermum erythrorhizon]|nr:hypothetical protein Leryth_025042 [Lithospermum erythrorhizon]